MRDPFDDLRRYAEHLEAQVPVERARARAMAALQPRHRPHREPRRRAITASATLVFMALSNAALASVADPSVPGDTLYGVDRAYERIGMALGLGGDHRFERLEEAAEVVERGDSSVALDLVIEALDGLVDDDAETARAIISGLENGADVAVLQAQIQLMIDIARDSADNARDEELRNSAGSVVGNGLDVAEIARRIRESVELPEQSSQDSPGDAADNKPDDAGKPDDPGKPDDAGKPPDTERPDDAGKPEETGSPPEDTVVEETPEETEPPAPDAPGQTKEPGPPADSPSDTRPPKEDGKKNG